MKYDIYKNGEFVATAAKQVEAAKIIGCKASKIRSMFLEGFKKNGFVITAHRSKETDDYLTDNEYDMKVRAIKAAEKASKKKVITEAGRFPNPLNNNILKCRFVQYGGDDRCNKCYLSDIATLDECRVIDCDGGYFMKVVDLQET